MTGLAATAMCLFVLGGMGACKKRADTAPQETVQREAEPHGQPERVAQLPQTLVLAQVLIELSDPDTLVSASESDLARQFGAQLLGSDLFVGSEHDVSSDRKARRVEVVLRIIAKLDEPSGERSGSVAVAVESSLRFVTKAAGDMEPRAALVVERALPSAEPEAVRASADEVLTTTLVSAGESLLTRVRLQRASDAELLAVLATDEPDATLKIWTLQLAAERGLREAVPVAIAALANPDEHVQAAAIAALVELDDERAVAALSRDVDFKDYESLRVVIEAVSAIGGEEALEFLEFVKSGHEDPDLRLRAEEGIRRLEAGRAGVSKSVN